MILTTINSAEGSPTNAGKCAVLGEVIMGANIVPGFRTSASGVNGGRLERTWTRPNKAGVLAMDSADLISSNGWTQT